MIEMLTCQIIFYIFNGAKLTVKAKIFISWISVLLWFPLFFYLAETLNQKFDVIIREFD